MRITGWRVDGFGVLSEHRVEGLPPGLTVVHGPNEAGKSTLLAFVRTMLFGFPSGRDSRPRHAPVRGGRHGGALFLADGGGGAWTIERHDKADATVAGPDGVVPADAGLKTLLGGVDRLVFESVFAFGLDELASIGSLGNDEVRDLVFSAGVLGAGRSATQALKSLAKRRELLVRPRQQSAVANRLRSELDDLDRELAELKNRARSYPAAAERCRRLREGARAAKERTEHVRRRLDELAALEACWPEHVAREAAARELAADAEPSPRDLSLLEHAADVERLARDRSGQEERLARRRELAARAREAEDARSAALARLGPGVDRARALSARVDGSTRSSVADLSERSAQAGARLEPAERAVHAASAALDQARRELDDATRRGDPGVAADELERLVKDLGDLEQFVGERDDMLARRHEAEQQARIAALESRGRVPLPRALAVALVLLSLLLGVAAALVSDRGAALSAVLAATAAALVALAGVAFSTGRATSAGATGPAPGGAGAAGDVGQDRVVRRIADLAGASGLPPAPTAAEVRTASQRAAGDLERRRTIERCQRGLEHAERSAEDARLALRSAEAAAADVAAEVRRVAAGLGVEPASADVAGLVELVRALDEIDRLRRDADAVASELDRTDRAVERYEEQVHELDAALGGHSPGSPVAPPAEGAARVAALEHELRAARAREDRRDDLRRRAETASAAIGRSLGDFERALDLTGELAGGDPVAWRAEREELAGALERAETQHESLVKELRDAERDLELLAESSEIAELELRRERVAAELAFALEQYAVAWLAGDLLGEALRRYERERQPEVVARAGALFEAVTGGRYVDLVARVDSDGPLRSELVAIDSTGSALDAGALSRGTAEQLYLCLRLALASSFARTAATLPIVLDDVLVNFDPARAEAVARAIAETSSSHQVIAFTCHPHLVEVLAGSARDARVVQLPASR